jgi:hypothetical protein
MLCISSQVWTSSAQWDTNKWLRTDVSSVAADSDPKDSVHYRGEDFPAREQFVGVHQANANFSLHSPFGYLINMVNITDVSEELAVSFFRVQTQRLMCH